MTWLLILISLIGLNFLFWSLVGLFRFLQEQRSKHIEKQQQSMGMHLKNPDHFGVLVILCVSIVSVVIFAFSTRFIENYFFTDFPSSPLFAAIILVLWSLYSLMNGYSVTRISRVLSLRYAFISGVVYWLLLELVQIPLTFGDMIIFFSSLSHTFILIHTLALVLSVLASSLGAFFAIVVNKRRFYSAPPTIEKLSISRHEVAAIMSAYNEEDTIAKTVQSLKRVLPTDNIYIGSDGSKDNTLAIGKSLGIHIFEKENSGKAHTLRTIIEKYDLLNKYKAVILIDADSVILPDYLDHALPLLQDPGTAAVAVHATSDWKPHKLPKLSMFFVAYRVRFYRLLQSMFRYGQTWKYTCVSTIVPGFASIYKTSALKHIEIDAPNLVIEDFNMTFEVHHKKLGRIAYSPAMKGITIDPNSLFFYYKQIKRWNLGFWQTVIRHGFWPSKFWAALAPYMIEIVPLSLFFLLFSPFILGWFLLNNFAPLTIAILPSVTLTITFWNFFIGLFLVDYIFTLIVALYERKPWLLFYGLGFLFMRYVDAFVMLYTLPLAFFKKSTGTWVSPRKKSIVENIE